MSRGAFRGRGRGFRGVDRGGYRQQERRNHGTDFVLPLNDKEIDWQISKQPEAIVDYLTDNEQSFTRRLAMGLRGDATIHGKAFLVDPLLALIVKATKCNTTPFTAKISTILGHVVESSFMKSELQRMLLDYFMCAPALLKPDEKEGMNTNFANICRLFTAVYGRRPRQFHEVRALAECLKQVYGHLTKDLALLVLSSKTIELYEHFLAVYEAMLDAERQIIAAVPAAKRPAISETAPPPNDFRTISIVPTVEDLLSETKPYLRANVVDGKYPDVETYLDIQFRLLREDFVFSIRKGVQDYRRFPEKFSGRGFLGEDVHIYHDVAIVRVEMSKTGALVHVLHFDAAPFKRVRWEISKRLLYGSLVCLSADNFDSFLFATVQEREPNDLKRGLLKVMFLANQNQVLPRGRLFVMAESTAYYEAYRHVLQGLQNMPLGQELRFYRYLVHCESLVNAPEYLQCSRQLRLEKGCILPNMFDKSQWPSKERLGLDEFQHEALFLALTKELALIQGPPGTGKTFIGLKIARLLLDKIHGVDQTALNRQMRLGGAFVVPVRQPILVVCYTNHALDQFLEGISKFLSDPASPDTLSTTGMIVRVGGRCKNEEMKRYLLNSVIQTIQFGDNVRRQFAQCRENLMHVEFNLRACQVCETMLREGILRWHQLSQCMQPVHKCMLLRSMPSHVMVDLGTLDEDAVVFYWLTDGLTIKQDQAKAATAAEGVNEASDEPDVEMDLPEDRQVIELGIDNKYNRVELEEALKQYSWNLRMHNMIPFPRLPTVVDEDSRDEGEWTETKHQKQKRKEKKMKEKAQKLLYEAVLMQLSLDEEITADEADSPYFRELWKLPMRDRWRLYRFWLSIIRGNIRGTSARFITMYQTAYQELQRIRDAEAVEVLQRARVIGMTTTGAAMNQHLLQQVRPKIVIIEEAAEVLEAHILTSLSRGCEHLIMIGDHFQLRPNPTVYELAKHYNLDVSLFERLIKNGIAFASLGYQHRMRPEIADTLMPHFYTNLKNSDSVNGYPEVCGIDKNMFFIDHRELEVLVQESLSHQNEYEAQFMVQLSLHLIKQGYRPDQITILCPYSGQVFLIKRKLSEVMPKTNCQETKVKISKSQQQQQQQQQQHQQQQQQQQDHQQQRQTIRVTAVDNFQGEENDIILLSLTRSNPGGRIGFLSVKNRVCVALSRAKHGFFCIGNFEMLAEKSDLWRGIIGSLTQGGFVSTALPISCRRHPPQLVTKPGDFVKLAPDGGCQEACGFRLDCGHVCPKKCHLLDSNHEIYECQKPCTKSCRLGHPCKRRCYEPCKCNEKVEKILKCGHPIKTQCSASTDNILCLTKVAISLKCGHTLEKECWDSAGSHNCLSPCETILNCGHKCDELCSVLPHTPRCNVSVQKKRSCGHTMSVLCHQNVDLQQCEAKVTKVVPLCGHEILATCNASTLFCKVSCDQILKCGHKCPGLCGQCKQGSHSTCKMPCRMELPCGHRCTGSCGACVDGHVQCSMVSQRTLICGHIGHYPCKDLFQRCKEKCMVALECGHQCQGTCYDCLGGRVHIRCAAPCGKQLLCGHRCAARCWEPCPPCTRVCERRCLHGSCATREWKFELPKCSERCSPCAQPCPWSCKHYQCARQCSEACDRPRCDYPCRVILKCGHPCLGLCGECCPPCGKCLPQCYEDGKGPVLGTKYVVLEDCGHVVDVVRMDILVDAPISNAVCQGFACCYFCHTPIVHTMRYKSVIIRTLRDMFQICNVIMKEQYRVQANLEDAIHTEHEKYPFMRVTFGLKESRIVSYANTIAKWDGSDNANLALQLVSYDLTPVSAVSGAILHEKLKECAQVMMDGFTLSKLDRDTAAKKSFLNVQSVLQWWCTLLRFNHLSKGWTLFELYKNECEAVLRSLMHMIDCETLDTMASDAAYAQLCNEVSRLKIFRQIHKRMNLSDKDLTHDQAQQIKRALLRLCDGWDKIGSAEQAVIVLAVTATLVNTTIDVQIPANRSRLCYTTAGCSTVNERCFDKLSISSSDDEDAYD